MTGANGLRLAQGDALILDLDGTLAEIVPDPDAVAPTAIAPRLPAKEDGSDVL